MTGPEVQKNGSPEASLPALSPGLTLQRPLFHPVGPMRERLFAIARFVSFVLIFVLFEWVISPELRDKRLSVIQQGLLSGGSFFAGALFSTAIMSRVDGRGFLSYGLRDRWMGRRFAAGVFWGFTSLTIFLACLRAAHHFYFGVPTLPAAQILHYALLFLLFFLLVGLAEETAFRGYALFTLAEGIGFWPAALVLAALFSFAHSHNSGESWFGVIAAGLFGFVISLSVLRSGSLWWAIGFHFMWDYAQSFIYGVADSGLVMPGHLLSAKFVGPAWITGGSVGPEGSCFVLLVLAGLALIIRLTLPSPPRSRS